MSGIGSVMVNSQTIGSSFIADGNEIRSVDAVGAGDTNHVIRRGLFLGGKRFSAGKAHDDVRFLERGVHRDALVKHEAVAVPMVAANALKIPEHPPFELLYVGKTGLHHDGTGFLTSNATRAKHDHRFVLHRCRKALNGFGEGPEGTDVQVDGVLEGPDPQLVVVPRVEDVNGFSRIEHGFELRRFNLLSGHLCGTDVVQTHRDDLVLLSYVHPVERLVIRARDLQGDIGESFVFLEVVNECINGRRPTGQKEIDALRGQQYRALQTQIHAEAA